MCIRNNVKSMKMGILRKVVPSGFPLSKSILFVLEHFLLLHYSRLEQWATFSLTLFIIGSIDMGR